MALTRDFKIAVIERIQREPELARAMLDEAMELLQNGDPEAARGMLRVLVHATVGFEGLAAQTNGDAKSLHRMLSAKGNPGMNKLSTILNAVRESIESQPRRRKLRSATA